ncbi:unnamed protein product [Cylicocyclus nassatus]|uniref:Uncharacterized protein n=1 Tax=Cylicocyclus nassatus TaxID=53992 RepID=A0AA36GFH6_CYLNA|nr:unnamed protein product [Cylicocyclus nassatus]
MSSEVCRKFLTRSDRVKSVDLHPTEPWLSAALYTGDVQIWNFESQELVKSLKVGLRFASACRQVFSK